MKSRFRVARFAVLCVVLVGAPGCGGGGGAGGSADGGHPADTGPGGIEGARVYGRILALPGDTPLEGATVTAREGGREVATATSGPDGRFAIDLPGAGAYAVTGTADGYTYAQRAVTVADGGVAAVRPMLLTPIDPTPIVLGPAGGKGANSDGSMELEAPPGALSSDTELHATWYSRGDALPNDLPPLSHFTYATELTSAGGGSFGAHIVVRMKNTRGFPPGTPIPVGVYDPATLQWRHESMGQVSADGQWVTYEVSHFSPRDCNLGRTSPAGGDGPGTASDQTTWRRAKKRNHPCSVVHAGSLVGVADGHLAVTHRVPGSLAHGKRWALTLAYDSARATHDQVLWLTYDITQTLTTLPDRIRFVAEVGGNRIERFYTPREAPMTFGYRWDGNDPLGNPLPAGDYAYKMTLTNEYRTTYALVDSFGGEAIQDTGIEADELLGLPAQFEGTVHLERGGKGGWPVGVNWGFAEVYELSVLGDGSVRIVGGDGSVFGFAAASGGELAAWPGQHDRLDVTQDGYTWTWHDGTTVAFDADGRELQQRDPDGNTTLYTYDDGDRLVAVAYPAGVSLTLAYDSGGRLKEITDSAGRVTHLVHDEAGDLVGITNPDGSTRHFTYDAAHHLTAQTDESGHETRYTYDETVAVVRIDRPDGSHTEHKSLLSLSDDGVADGTVEFTDGEGATYRYGVNAYGTRTHIEDPLGRLLELRRNDDDQIRAIVWSNDGDAPDKVIGYHYDERGNLTNIGAAGTNSDYAPEAMTLTYDAANRPLSIEDGVVGKWAFEYDAQHRSPVAVTLPDGRRCAFTLDEHGLRVSADLAGLGFAYAYDERGNLVQVTGPDGASWSYGYDERGNLVSLRDPDGREQVIEYDLMDRPTRMAWGEGIAVQFSYTPGGRIASVVSGASAATHFTYDERGRLASMTDPLGNETSYRYDGEGRLLERILPDGRSARWTYDAAGEVTRMNVDDSGEVRFTYGEHSGLLRMAEAPACVSTFEYDEGFRVTSETHTFDDGLAVTLSYDYPSASYSAFDVALGVGDESWTAEWSFGNRGLLPDAYTGIGDGSVGLTRDAAGFVVGWESWSGWTSAAFERDGAGRLLSAAFTDGYGDTAVALAMTYTAAGLLSSLTAPDGVHSFAYDDAGRLVAATHPTADNPDEAFTYDAAGNRRAAGHEDAFVFDEARRLLADAEYTYQYDAAGNRVSRTSRADGTTTSYAYDALGRLVRVETAGGNVVTYRYDALGRRVERLVDGQVTTRYIWAGSDVIAELDGSGRLARGLVRARQPDRVVGIDIFDSEGAPHPHYLATDDRGTTYGVFNDDGDLLETYHYTAFGLPLGLPSAPLSTRLFAGMDYDPVTGLYYARARFYDPVSGTFLQRDPVPLRSALAPYEFAANRPGNTTDPYGEAPDAQAAAFKTLVDNTVVQPNIATATTEAVSRIPVVGGKAAGIVGVYFQARDLIHIALADDPLEAGRNWYKSQWWNPAGKYVDTFISLGADKAGGQGKPQTGHATPGCAKPPLFSAFLTR